MDYQHNLTDSGHEPSWEAPVSLLGLIWTSLPALLCISLYWYSGSRLSPVSDATDARALSIDKMQIIPARIAHRRLVPVSHGFTYPYLTVGIPVRSPTSNWLLSTDGDGSRRRRRGWLHVSAGHHLHRGRDGLTLSDNLDGYLREQGLDPSDYPHAYLVTGPCLFGYRFSPASFWYLYTSDRRLAHVIAEVNNTFSERRMYLFSAAAEQQQHGESKSRFRQTHQKDFHVSPFSSRRGSYVLSTVDPADGDLSITITLRSSGGVAKLVARWWSSEGDPIDPAQLSISGSLWLLLSWGWGILVTYPRIVMQAIWLAQARKLHIWYRPEPRQSAVPRTPTASETFLESVLARYMDHIRSRADTPICLSLSHPGDGHSHSHSSQSGTHLRIHAPHFYRRMITYGTLADLLQDTLLDAHEENRSAWSDNPESLITATRSLEAATRPRRAPTQTLSSNLVTHALGVLWAIHAYLRGDVTPLPGSYPDPGLPSMRNKKLDPDAAAMTNGTTIHLQAEGGPLAAKRGGVNLTGRSCFLDDFVRQEEEGGLQLQYMLATLLLQWRTTLMGYLGGE